MLFMAHAYQRPIIAGVHDGQALYVSPHSNKDLQQASIISDDVPYNKSQTIYTRLGDLYILLILASLTAISQFYPIMKRRLHAKNLQNRR
jgi:apolipoprotein N-acyltransferase